MVGTITRKALLEVDIGMMYYDEWLCVKMKVYGSYIQLLVHLQGLLFGKNQRMRATSTSAFQIKPSLYIYWLLKFKDEKKKLFAIDGVEKNKQRHN